MYALTLPTTSKVDKTAPMLPLIHLFTFTNTPLLANLSSIQRQVLVELLSGCYKISREDLLLISLNSSKIESGCQVSNICSFPQIRINLLGHRKHLKALNIYYK